MIKGECAAYVGITSPGVNFVQGTNRAACSCPNPTANLVGLFTAGTKGKGIGVPVLFLLASFNYKLIL
ncbi:MAG: hypothetical protein K6T94_13125 [Paenibacillus sp.]|nr:hypothetical protein [Paenibacillus sp.]